MPSIDKRLTELESIDSAIAEGQGLGAGPVRRPAGAGPPAAIDEFAQYLREARLRSEAGNPIPQTPITQQMLDDPLDGEFWRQMKEARERVARLRVKEKD
jgi:hypothetical protein